MKKVLGALALACVLMTASGCGSKNSGAAGTDHFKEYSFTNPVTETQKAKIKEGLEKSLDSLSSITGKYEFNSKYSSATSKQTLEGTLKVCEDSSRPNQLIITYSLSGSSNSISDGITLTSKTKSQYKIWDGGHSYAITSTTTTTDGVTKDEYEADEITEGSKAYKDEKIKQNVSFPSSSSLSYYQNSDGSFTAIYSEIDKSVSGVQWGNETKEHIEETKEQRVYKISKDYLLKSYYFYEEHSSNRDPETNEWYGSVQVYSRYYTSIEYKYGKREYVSIDKLNSSVSSQEIPLAMSIKEINSTHSESDFSVISENEGYTVSCSSVSDSDGAKRYRFVTNEIEGYYGSGYYGKRFVLNITSLRGATSLSQKEIKLSVSNEVGTDYNVSNYFYRFQASSGYYFVNVSSSYRRLQIYFSVTTNSQASIDAIYLY